MAAAAAAASALLPSRGRRNGTQIFPGRRRGHSNQPNNQFSGMYQVSNEQIQRRNERKDDDGNLDTLRVDMDVFEMLPHVSHESSQHIRLHNSVGCEKFRSGFGMALSVVSEFII
ncbi:unnamed protein product [Anisakis simplex]|uniref:Protein BEX4 n=1 Tax=Anisakis simplex TaxID=6269 RepID=A0A0M3KK91_ANISI|nr:unnamed protein product [Anisakis simplex]